MTTTNHTTTFWNFLKNYEIEIPIIQRDYAQGRIGKESLRKNFLNDLREALDKKEEMKLDFVYGSTENGKLYPLDGQQRLTTLWLLHWYIALKAGKLEEASDHLKNFSYETRVSSRNFCEEMCNPKNFINFYGNDVVEFITNQTWFYSAWKQDPTIQSMLRMLGGSHNNKITYDSIEKVFCCKSYDCISKKKCRIDNYFNLLTGEKCPIVFYYLPKDFGNSDDLYIKMNARGEQLTSFENFKADLIGYITKQSENELFDESRRAEWKKLLDPESGIPKKLDTEWTDIFWNLKSKGTSDCRMINRIDDIYFAFINRFFWNELFIAKDKYGKYILDIGKGDENSTQENNNISYKYLNDSDNKNDYDTKIAYKGLDVYKYDDGIIPISFFQKMMVVMNNLSAYLKNDFIPECSWNNNFYFVPTYEKDNSGNNVEITNNASDRILKVTTLNQIQRIVFFSICKYFDHDNTIKDDDKSLKRWLRVVWNLVSGEDENGRPQIRSTQAMRTAIGFIEKLDSHDVYKSLISYKEDLGDSDFDERCREEITKAKQILNENGQTREYDGDHKKEDGSIYKTWEEIIKDAEKYAFFKGAIRFLFTGGEGHIIWSDFDSKWGNAQKFFDQNGVKYGYTVSLTRSLVIQCDNWGEQLYDKQIFRPNANTWKWILTAKNWIEPIHNILMGNNISATNESNDENVKKYMTPILKKLPFDYLINNEPDGRFRWLGERLCFYKPYGRNMATLDWGNWRRNEMLSSLLKSNIITTDAQMGDSDFFWGWNVNFIYRGKFFQWYGNPNDKKLDIYLMEEEWKDYKKRLNPTNDKGTEEDTHFCFRVDINTIPVTFVKKLDCLIAQAYPLESNKTCCDKCQNKICE